MAETDVRYTLWRQDDNGNRFAVAVFARREEAEEQLLTFSLLPHRQIYWIEEAKELSP
jgi:hypothetical protein